MTTDQSASMEWISLGLNFRLDKISQKLKESVMFDVSRCQIDNYLFHMILIVSQLSDKSVPFSLCYVLFLHNFFVFFFVMKHLAEILFCF